MWLSDGILYAVMKTLCGRRADLVSPTWAARQWRGSRTIITRLVMMCENNFRSAPVLTLLLIDVFSSRRLPFDFNIMMVPKMMYRRVQACGNFRRSAMIGWAPRRQHRPLWHSIFVPIEILTIIDLTFYHRHMFLVYAGLTLG